MVGEGVMLVLVFPSSHGAPNFARESVAKLRILLKFCGKLYGGTNDFTLGVKIVSGSEKPMAIGFSERRFFCLFFERIRRT